MVVWVFSLSTTELIPYRLTARLLLRGIRSLIEFSTQLWALAHSVLYLTRSTYPTLALKLFRREPAITGFD